MPSEKFYGKTAVEGKVVRDLLEVSWGKGGAEWTPTVSIKLTVDGRYANIEADRSGLNRLIKALRKARDQTFGEDA